MARARRRSTGSRRKGKIRIKTKNKGAFTRQARAKGMGVQAYARKVMAAPKGRYSAKTRSRANFARNFGGLSHRKATRKKG